MTKRNLPQARDMSRPKAFDWDAPADALEKWKPTAAVNGEADTISIMDVIGVDFWTGEGVTAKRIAAALRSIGAKDVTVKINSPGGDMFEGLAIYNLLREHQGAVTVKVMGLAASAASIIAMAGDTIEMGLGSFLMVHNSWGMVIGNQADMRDAAKTFAEFDAAMADIYVARTGGTRAEIEQMMADETWLRAEAAISAGFADSTFAAPDAPQEDKATKARSAKAALDAALAKSGMPRSERRRLLGDASGTPRAADPVTPRADIDMPAALRLLNALKS
jgi:ATP-dependent protease ClpP protease subunit